MSRLQYSVSRSQLATRSVLISVWHHGLLSRNTFLGEVEVPLDLRNLDSASEDRLRLLGKVDLIVSVELDSFLGCFYSISRPCWSKLKATAEGLKSRRL